MTHTRARQGHPPLHREEPRTTGSAVVEPAISDPAQIIQTIRRNATTVNSTSQERVAFIADLIQRANQLRNEVEELAKDTDATRSSVATAERCVDAIDVSIKDICGQAMDVSQPVEEMDEIARAFRDEFSAVQRSAQRLGSLASTIRLLAINASIEAVRAGDAGVGFAVVAQNVRSLAEDSEVDLVEIGKVAGRLDQMAHRLTDKVDIVTGLLRGHADTAQACNAAREALCQDVKTLGEHVIEASNKTEAKLPQIRSLIADIEQIKANTEAAVDGSARNIGLCDQALRAMTTGAYQDTPSRSANGLKTA